MMQANTPYDKILTNVGVVNKKKMCEELNTHRKDPHSKLLTLETQVDLEPFALLTGCYLVRNNICFVM